MIYFHNEDIDLPKIKKQKIKNWVKRVVSLEERKVGEINFIFCSDEYLLNINRTFLKHNFYTDVITFDYVENQIINGDIYISIERVEDNANKLGIDKDSEIKRIIIHGVLHLLGYNDKTSNEKKRITEMEDKYLRDYEKFR